MIESNDVSVNLEEWLKNPTWAVYYNGAPSDRCREFIALEFYYSEFEDDKVAEEMDRIEEELDVASLRHLFKYCGHNPRKGFLARKIEEKERAGEVG